MINYLFHFNSKPFSVIEIQFNSLKHLAQGRFLAVLAIHSYAAWLFKKRLKTAQVREIKVFQTEYSNWGSRLKFQK